MIPFNKAFKYYTGDTMPGDLVVFPNGLFPTCGVVIDISDTENEVAVAVVSELTLEALAQFNDDRVDFSVFLSQELSIAEFPLHTVSATALHKLSVEKGHAALYVKLVGELNDNITQMLNLRDNFFGKVRLADENPYRG